MKSDNDIRHMTVHWTRAQPAVGRFVRSFVRNPTEAEDVLQEVALVIVDRYDSYDFQQPFIGWALGIARRVVWSHLRKKYRNQDLVLTDAVDKVAAAFEQLDPHAQRMKDALSLCIQKVQGTGRDALRLRYEEGFELEQIGAKLGKTANSIGVLLHRVRTTLRECVQRQLSTEQA